MTIKEKEGYELAKGAFTFISRIIIGAIILVWLLHALLNCIGWGTDDSQQ